MNRYLDLVDPWTRPSRAQVDDLSTETDYVQAPLQLDRNRELVEPIPSTIVVGTSRLSCSLIQAMVEGDPRKTPKVWASILLSDKNVFKVYHCTLEGMEPVLLGLVLVDGLETSDLHRIAWLVVESFSVSRWIVLDSIPNYQFGLSSENNIITRYCFSSKCMQDATFRPCLSQLLQPPTALTGLSAALMTRLEVDKQCSCAIVVSENQLDDPKESASALLIALQSLLSWKVSVEYMENYILPCVKGNITNRNKRNLLYL